MDDCTVRQSWNFGVRRPMEFSARAMSISILTEHPYGNPQFLGKRKGLIFTISLNRAAQTRFTTLNFSYFREDK